MRNAFAVAVAVLGLSLVSTWAPTQELAPISLPAPKTEGGKPLMEALKLRATSRAFATDALPAQTISNLLWAAFGINRPQEGKRTAPSARNFQEIDVIVVMPAGAYLYDAQAVSLKPLVAGDLRALTGVQEFVKDAPLTLVFVADQARMKGPAAEMQSYAYADAAFISENVYLFCASEGLATGVRAMLDRPALAKALKLRADQMIVMAQCVGLPKR
jgi:nitroreductase